MSTVETTNYKGSAQVKVFGKDAPAINAQYEWQTGFGTKQILAMAQAADIPITTLFPFSHGQFDVQPVYKVSAFPTKFPAQEITGSYQSPVIAIADRRQQKRLGLEPLRLGLMLAQDQLTAEPHHAPTSGNSLIDVPYIHFQIMDTDGIPQIRGHAVRSVEVLQLTLIQIEAINKAIYAYWDTLPKSSNGQIILSDN